MPTAKILVWISVATFSVGSVAAGAPAAAPTTPPPSTPPVTTPTSPSSTCVTALPRIAGLARATLNSQCGSRDGVVHNGDAIALQARGHFRLEARLESGSLEVTCVSSNEPVIATIGDGQAPWFHLDGDAVCSGWNKNEQVCARDGTELLVCDAATQKARVPIAARPLGIPAWYVREVEPVPETPASSPPPEPATATEPGKAQRVLRMAVTDVAHDADLEPRVARIFADSFAAELRKLNLVSVISMDEVRSMLSVEANRQAVGCSEDESCLAEIADALGADVVISGSIAFLDDRRVLSLKRIDQKMAIVTLAFEERLVRADGEELLAAIGPAVEHLFPDRSLQKGKVRGVAPEKARLLHPPPLHTWATGSVAGLSAVAGAGAIFTGILAQTEANATQALLQQSTPENPADGARVGDSQARFDGLALTSNIMTVSAIVIGIGAAVMVPFTDWTDARANVEQ